MTILSNRAHWARTYLSKAGLLHSPKRNQHLLTPRGKAFLQTNPLKIDNEILSGFEEFSAWKAMPKQANDNPTTASHFTAESKTPEELIDAAFHEIQETLRADILDLLTTMNPIRFERLILDLLKAMGYGAGALGAHLMTKSSGDGGIDGIIHEDALGLDAVYIQAKRYAPDSRIGRPAIQQFIGSLTGEGANKGVFVTTSDFSKEAREYLTKVQHRVVLINGLELARLMIAHGVGVRDRIAYVIRTVDADYFSDPDG